MPKVGEGLKPFWTTSDTSTVKLYLGDVTKVLRRLPTQSVHCVVTSPPYWGLRDYGTGVWEGGDPACKHAQENRGTVQYLDRNGNPGKNTTWQGAERHSTVKPGVVCKHCGAIRVEDQQIGSEPSPDCGTQGKAQCGWCFICSMVGVFREVRRVLRDDGTLWLNLGDTYSSGKSGRDDSGDKGRFAGPRITPTERKPTVGLPSGNMVGVPWRVALALQADGWILRQDIVWHKPSPMPESVRNRCTKAHEYVFLFAKKQGYYCDMEAVKEPLKMSNKDYSKMLRSKSMANHHKSGTSLESGCGGKEDGPNQYYEDNAEKLYVPNGSNKRSVWTVASAGYPGAHFATFPPRLIEPCILAGTSEKGCCSKCGTPWKRIVEEKKLTRERPNEYVKRAEAGVEVKTVGWEPSCECFGHFEKREGTRLGYGAYHSHEADGVGYGLRLDGGPVSNPGEPTKEFPAKWLEYVSDTPLEDHPIVPCTVCDIFLGSGTTAVVATDHGRRCWGIDLSEKYLRNNAIPRIEGALMARPGTAGLAGREAKAVEF